MFQIKRLIFIYFCLLTFAHRASPLLLKCSKIQPKVDSYVDWSHQHSSRPKGNDFECIFHGVNLYRHSNVQYSYDAELANQIITKVTFESSVVEEIPRVLFEHHKIEKLTVSNCSVSAIQSGLFVSADSLETLDLTSNSLTELSADAFHGARALAHILLSANLITRIDLLAFRGLDRLETIILADNRLVTLHSRTFESLPNLGFLSISDNQLSGPLELVFSSSRMLNLMVSGNALTKLIVFAGRGSRNILYIFADNNRISELQVDAAFSLKILEIESNQVSDWAQVTAYADLNILRVSRNPLESLHDATFTRLASLKDLSMANVSLKYLPKGVLSPLKQLQALDISSNELDELPIAEFNELENLKEVKVNGNRLRKLNVRKVNRSTELRLKVEGNLFFCEDLAVWSEELETMNIKLESDSPAFDEKNVDGIECKNKPDIVDLMREIESFKVEILDRFDQQEKKIERVLKAMETAIRHGIKTAEY